VLIALRDKSGCLRERETQVFALEESSPSLNPKLSEETGLEATSNHALGAADQVLWLPPCLLFNMGVDPCTLSGKNYQTSVNAALREEDELEVTVMPADWFELSSRDGDASELRRSREAMGATVEYPDIFQ